MLARMPESLFLKWQQFWNVEPFGPIQEDARVAPLTSMFHAVHRKKGDSALSPADWFPSLKSAAPKDIGGVQQLTELFKGMAERKRQRSREE